MYKELSKILIAAHRLEPSNGCSRPCNTSGKKTPISINRDNCSSFVSLPSSALNNKKEGVIE
jgi:hypothetical protein